MPASRRLHSVAVATVSILLALAVPQAVAATIYYVDPGGNDANDCLTPATACRTIQAGLNKASGSDTIQIATGTYVENLTASAAHQGTTLQGAGAASTIVDGNDSGSVLKLPGAYGGTVPRVVVRDLTLRNGSGSPIYSANRLGGGIYAGIRSTLTLANVVVTGNSADYGGGIWGDQYATMNIERSTLSENAATSWAGAAYLYYNTVDIRDSTIAGNTSGSWVGGIALHSSTGSIRGSTFRDNSAGVVGGLESRGSSVLVADSTFSGNSSSDNGGGIRVVYQGITLNNVTITDNTAASGYGGGLAMDNYVAGATVSNSIIAGNHGAASPDCVGALTSDGYNLIQSIAGCTIAGPATGDVYGQDPLLGPLQDNGGSTMTHALAPTSPAIDAGNPAVPGGALPACEALDQRGAGRDGRCDIGAFELYDSDNDGVPDSLDCDDGNPSVQQTVIEYPDADGDGVRNSTVGTQRCVPTGAPASDGSTYNTNGPDNCAATQNADQANSDADPLGDACNPFPLDDDNEQALCELNVGVLTQEINTCRTELAECRLTPPSLCPSNVSTIAGLRAEVLGLTLSNSTLQILLESLDQASQAIAQGKRDLARLHLQTFIQRAIQRSNMAAGQANHLGVLAANSLICGAANVLVTIAP